MTQDSYIPNYKQRICFERAVEFFSFITVQQTPTHTPFDNKSVAIWDVCKKRLNRQQTAHKCIHVTTCVQLGGKEFAMLSRGYLIYVSAACPFKYARILCDIIWSEMHSKQMGSRTLQSAKGGTQTSIIRDLQIMQFCRIQKHLEIEYCNIIWIK